MWFDLQSESRPQIIQCHSSTTWCVDAASKRYVFSYVDDHLLIFRMPLQTLRDVKDGPVEDYKHAKGVFGSRHQDKTHSWLYSLCSNLPSCILFKTTTSNLYLFIPVPTLSLPQTIVWIFPEAKAQCYHCFELVWFLFCAVFMDPLSWCNVRMSTIHCCLSMVLWVEPESSETKPGPATTVLQQTCGTTVFQSRCFTYDLSTYGHLRGRRGSGLRFAAILDFRAEEDVVYWVCSITSVWCNEKIEKSKIQSTQLLRILFFFFFAFCTHENSAVHNRHQYRMLSKDILVCYVLLFHTLFPMSPPCVVQGNG
jgi:hypothetical protein